MDSPGHSTNSPLEELTRDEDLWLEDGSVVLVAGRTAFKVYKGSLSAHSPVFSDMFSSAIPADETYDRCPMGRVPESPEDLKWLLTYLVPKSLRYLEDSHQSTYPELSALARLGHKYQVDPLQRLAITRLKSMFTNDVDQWEAHLGSQTVLRSPGYLSYNPIDIIEIARLTDNPSMLPLAFCLCAQNEAIIIDGQAREDGTPLVLSKSVKIDCHLYVPIKTIHLVASQPDCATPVVCRAALHTMLATVSQERGTYLLEGLYDSFFLPYEGCSACSQTIKRFRQDARRELWKKLPRIFGLQDELKGHWPGY